MRATQGLIAILALWAGAPVAWAQGAAPPPGPVAPSPGTGAGGASAVLAAIVLVVTAIVVIGGLVKILDLRRRREAEAVQLQAQVADALLRDPQLFGLPVTATARVGWRGSPAVLELAGQVPSVEAREAVLRVARDEAARIRPDVTIEERLAVVPAVTRAA